MHEHTCVHSHTCTLAHASTHMYTQVYLHTFTHATSLPSSLLCSLHTDHTGLLAFLHIPAVCPPQGLCTCVSSSSYQVFFSMSFSLTSTGIYMELSIYTLLTSPWYMFLLSIYHHPHTCVPIFVMFTLSSGDNASSLGSRLNYPRTKLAVAWVNILPHHPKCTPLNLPVVLDMDPANIVLYQQAWWWTLSIKNTGGHHRRKRILFLILVLSMFTLLCNPSLEPFHFTQLKLCTH